MNMPKLQFTTEITLGTILQTIVVVGTLIGVYVKLDERITKVEVTQHYQERSIDNLASRIDLRAVSAKP